MSQVSRICLRFWFYACSKQQDVYMWPSLDLCNQCWEWLSDRLQVEHAETFKALCQKSSNSSAIYMKCKSGYDVFNILWLIPRVRYFAICEPYYKSHQRCAYYFDSQYQTQNIGSCRKLATHATMVKYLHWTNLHVNNKFHAWTMYFKCQ